MINLISTTKLQAVLSAAKTTNDSPVVVYSRNRSGYKLGMNSAVENPTPTITNTNGVTAVDICAAPASVANEVTVTQVEGLTVFNNDTVPITVTIQMLSGTSFGTTSILIQRTLQPGDTLEYEAGLGWTVLTNTAAVGRLVSMQSAGTAFGSFTTAKTMLPAQAVGTLAPNFWSVGKVMIIEGVFGLSNIVTTPGTLTLQVMIGAVIAFTTGAIQMSTTAHTLLPIWFRILLTCRSVGTGTNATLMGQAIVGGQGIVEVSGADATNNAGFGLFPKTAPAVGTGFDSTVSNALDFFAGFSISDPANVVQMQQYMVWSY